MNTVVSMDNFQLLREREKYIPRIFLSHQIEMPTLKEMNKALSTSVMYFLAQKPHELDYFFT